MRALVYDNQLQLNRAVPEPELRPDEALLKLRCGGICNTDLELVAGLYGFSGILGHEFVAEVVRGPEALLGQRVVGEINVACTQCDFCQQGIPSQCRHRTTVGINGHAGAFADYLGLAARNLYPVPEAIRDSEAVFVEPLAAALQVPEAVHISPRDRVVVIGLGKLGLLVAQVLRLTGAAVIGVVRHDNQARLLQQWGIAAAEYQDLESERAQIVVDCTGQGAGFNDALRLVEPRGTIVLKSTFHGLSPLDLTQIALREIRVIGSRCGPFEAALRLLKLQVVDVGSLIEARYPFDQAVTAMEHAAQKGALKVLLDF